MQSKIIYEAWNPVGAGGPTSEIAGGQEGALCLVEEAASGRYNDMLPWQSMERVKMRKSVLNSMMVLNNRG